MLDLKFLRENPEFVAEALKKRGGEYPLKEVLQLDERRRELIQEVEVLRHARKTKSEEIGLLKKKERKPRPRSFQQRLKSSEKGLKPLRKS